MTPVFVITVEDVITFFVIVLLVSIFAISYISEKIRELRREQNGKEKV